MNNRGFLTDEELESLENEGLNDPRLAEMWIAGEFNLRALLGQLLYEITIRRGCAERAEEDVRRLREYAAK